jgi:hypothetical protein
MPQVIEVPGYGEVEFPDGMSDDQISAAIKKSMQPVENPAMYGGAGGYNPIAGRIGGSIQALSSELGLTPENTASPIKNAFGPAETALQFGTAGVATPIAGLAGIGQGVWNKLAPESLRGPDAANRVRQVQGAMTYQPRTGMGAGMSRVVGLPGEKFAAGTNYLGEKTAEVTRSPLLGSAVKTVGDIAPAVVGAKFSGARMPQPKPSGKYTPSTRSVPTSAELKAASDALYKAADESNVVIRPESTRKVVDMLQSIADKENLGKLPPKMKEAADILTDRADTGKPLSLSDADKVRQLINDAKKSTDPADQRLAKIAQKQYDDYLDNLKPEDTLAGDAATGVAVLKQAREMYKRRRGSEMIDSMERKAGLSGDAKYSQAGLEHALRTEFLKLARNDKKMQMLTAEQRAAIERVASPGVRANILRNIGKFDPTKGGMPAFMTSVVGGGGGALLGGPGGAVAGPALLGVLANLANRGAAKITKANVSKARESMVGSESGLLDAGPNAKPLSVQKGPLGQQSPRSPDVIRAEIYGLEQRAGKLSAQASPSSPEARAIWKDLELLQAELKQAESRGESAGVLGR